MSRVLGILWTSVMDTFRFEIEIHSFQSQVTKRTFLSEVSRLFDPIGLLRPVVIIPKLLMQSGNRGSIGMSQFRLECTALRRLPWWRQGYSDPWILWCESARMHVLYIRVQASESDVDVRLLCSKSRVAPLHLCGFTSTFEAVSCIIISSISRKIVIIYWPEFE